MFNGGTGVRLALGARSEPMKQKLKSGDEVDAICDRKTYSWKAGVLKKIKRALNKRMRTEGKVDADRAKTLSE